MPFQWPKLWGQWKSPPVATIARPEQRCSKRWTRLAHFGQETGGEVPLRERVILHSEVMSLMRTCFAGNICIEVGIAQTTWHGSSHLEPTQSFGAVVVLSSCPSGRRPSPVAGSRAWRSPRRHHPASRRCRASPRRDRPSPRRRSRPRPLPHSRAGRASCPRQCVAATCHSCVCNPASFCIIQACA